jgi:RNA polymerase sigma-70 factor (ECF subfamily)
MKKHDLNLLKKGDIDVFKRIFEDFYMPLVIYARSMLKDHDEAEEVVQDLFLAIWEKHAELTINSSLKSYLFMAVKNRCLGYFKHEKVKNRYKDIQSRSANKQPLPDEEIMYKETVSRIKGSIELMPEKTRKIFLMNRDQGITYNKIAEKMDISVKTVEVHMGKALKILRENLRVILFLLFLALKI